MCIRDRYQRRVHGENTMKRELVLALICLLLSGTSVALRLRGAQSIEADDDEVLEETGEESTQEDPETQLKSQIGRIGEGLNSQEKGDEELYKKCMTNCEKLLKGLSTQIDDYKKLVDEANQTLTSSSTEMSEVEASLAEEQQNLANVKARLAQEKQSQAEAAKAKEERSKRLREAISAVDNVLRQLEYVNDPTALQQSKDRVVQLSQDLPGNASCALETNDAPKLKEALNKLRDGFTAELADQGGAGGESKALIADLEDQKNELWKRTSELRKRKERTKAAKEDAEGSISRYLDLLASTEKSLQLAKADCEQHEKNYNDRKLRNSQQRETVDKIHSLLNGESGSSSGGASAGASPSSNASSGNSTAAI
eukprot:TRINITY_DN15267_c0_g1_i2.p1 TRINITY_DN15267_c0_g1~~TRINITY_DN15267_c0_g1_i2.p1  ORF type:complete len:369 (-),score=148.19 TRINITY_DN15267_c0_g1_i2:147-1253(-)